MKKTCAYDFFCASCRISMICIAVIALFLTSCAKEKVVISCADDLADKKIGVQAGTTGETYVQKNVRGAKISSFKSGIDAALDLKTGAIDAVVLDELPAKEIVARNPELAIVHDFFAREEYAIAVKKGNTALLEIINNTIKEIKANGEYEKLTAAFMPVDGNIVIPESESLNGTNVIKLGTNAAFPPFEYVDGKTITGFDIFMGQKIARSCGARLEVVDMSFGSLIPALQSGAIDFIAAGMSVSEERKKNVDFSIPYYESEQVIIIRKANEK